MRILVPSAAACAAAVMVTTFGLSSSTAAIAVPVNPDISATPLTDLDADGLDLAGARASSESTSTASHRGLVNVPGLLRAPQGPAAAQTPVGPLVSGGGAFAATNTSLTDSSASPGATEDSGASADSGSAPALGESSDPATAPDDAEASEPAESDAPVVGSVKEETEDGVAIAAISDAVEVPSGNPSVVGVTYEGDAGVSFEVRTKTGGEWGAWTDLDIENTDEGGNGTEPFIVAGSDSVQLRVLGDADAPSATELVLVDPKSSANDAAAVQENQPVLPPQTAGDSAPAGEAPAADGSAEAPEAANATAANGATAQNTSYVPGSSSVDNASVKKVAKPSIGSRKSWGANEKLRSGSPDYASSVKAAVVHHTAGANGYKAEDVPSILRGIYSFHTKGRGWSDVGYNVLADKYGRLWEGRAGGLDKAVIGAHVAGYNTGSFGISVMGSYEKSAPPQKTLDAVNHAIAWKLSANGVSADGRTTLGGKKVRTVVGHRDLGQTACPGAAFYSKMGGMRDAIVKMQKGGATPEDKKDEKEQEKSKTPIEKKYEGNVEQLGKPSGKEFDIAGGRAQKYEKGHIYWTSKTGAHIVRGAINGLVDEKKLQQIGFPTNDEKGGLKDGGTYQKFTKGSVHWSKASGAHATTGVLQGYWKAKGYERGHLGYPTGELTVKDGRAEQTFQGARLVWADGYGTTEFSPSGDINAGVEDLNQREGGESGEPGEGPSDEPTVAPTQEPTTEPTEEASPEPTESASPTPSATPSPAPTKTAEPKPSKEPEKTEEQKDEEKRAAVIAEAKKHLGVKYRWGGTSPKTGWDCSGYTQDVYGKSGIKLPRTTSAQRGAGEVISAKEAKPGDLIWVPGHIGIISETKGQMYDAGSSRTNTSKRSYDWMVKRGAVFIRVI